MLKIQVDVGGAIYHLELTAQKFGDLLPVMPAFTAYMRKEIDGVFASGGHGAWPPTKKPSESTIAARIAKVEAGKYRGLQSRLRAETKRASKRLARGLSVSQQKKGVDASKLTQRRAAALARKESHIAEVNRLASGGELKPEGQAKLYERVGRRIAQADAKIAAIKSGKALGAIAQSFSINFDRHNWEMASRIPWAGVHNDGGVAGRGAVIPKRTFLEWTKGRIATFAELAETYLAGERSKSNAS